MTGTQDRTNRRIVIVGAGVAGLAAAHRVVELAAERQTPVDVRLLEARDRVGGSIVTTHRDGFLIEGGPDSFITQKPWGLTLCKRIGLADQIIPTNPACRRTFVVRDGIMHAIPEGFLLLAPSRIWPFVTSRLFSWPGKLRMGLDLVLPRRHHGPDGDESLASFVRRRFGPEALARVAQPLVGGIYTADPETLSLRTTMPRFLDMEAKYRSLILGMRKGAKAARRAGASTDSGARYSLFVSLADGMSVLVDTLMSRLPAGAVRTDAPVARIERDAGRWRVVTATGDTEDADAIILACPSYASANVVRALDGELADGLAAIDFASSATMTMAFREEQVPRLPEGFGFVVPVIERRTLIAVTFSSVKFAGRAPEGHVLMRAFLGGALQPEVYDLDDDRLVEAVRRDLRELLGVEGEPAFVETHRWPRSMPQYPVGHLDRLRRIEARVAALPGLAVAGNAYAGVGIPDCVHSGEVAAERLLDGLASAGDPSPAGPVSPPSDADSRP